MFPGVVIAAAMVAAYAAPALMRTIQRGSEARRTVAVVAAPRPRPAARVDAMNELIAAMGSRPLLPPISVTIVGELDAPGAGDPTVIVRLGDLQVPATVSGNTFQAEFVRVQPRSMVTVEASRNGVQYRALLGTVASLKRQSGGDGRVDTTENPSLRVSPMSTAVQFFIRVKYGGRLPISDDETDRALSILSQEDVSVAANAIRALGAGEVSLPETHPSVDVLLGDRDAYRAFLARNVSIRNNAPANVRSMRFGTFVNADLEREWLLAGQNGQSEFSYVRPDVQLMQKRQGGFLVHTVQARGQPEFDAVISPQGSMITTPLGQPYFDGWIYYQNPQSPGGSYDRYAKRTSIIRETYKRIFVGGKRELWLRLREQRTRVPSDPAQPETQEVVSSFWTASDFSSSWVPATESNISGRRTFPYFCMRPSSVAGEAAVLDQCEHALFFVGSNGVATADGLGRKVDDALGRATASGTANLQWQIDGSGRFSMSDGAISVRFWRLGSTDGVGDAMVFLATAVSGGQSQTLAGHAISLNGNNPVYMNAEDHVGGWRYASFDLPNYYAHYESAPASHDRFDRNADGTQVQTSSYWYYNSISGAPDEVIRARSAWGVFGGNLYDTRYRANALTGEAGLVHYSSCQQANERGATYCMPMRVRYFKPIAKVGNRWYGIEELYVVPITDYVLPLMNDRTSRPTYYEKLPL